ncbi:MAG TPA: hypothetical protein PKE40_01070 [Arachnia sp.]|nr:hypothetical protein [Arachnia sp.]HMT84918.1 hypothetical protein [Arachnia sp.]
MSPSTSEPQVVAGRDDLATAQALAEFRAAHPGTPVTAVFAEQETADLFRHLKDVTALAWAPALAREVTAAVPPHPLGQIAPPPVVVGDGMLARHVVAGFVLGWSDPGQPLPVHCLGADPSWAEEAEEATSPRGELAWHRLAPRPSPVVRCVRRLVDEWTRPLPKEGQPGGVAVVVALEDAATTLTVAGAVVTAVPEARVVAVVDDDSIWPAVPGVTVFTIDDARAATATRRHSAEGRFVEQLLADIAWVTDPAADVTAPTEPIFAPLDQPAEVRAQAEALVRTAAEIFAAGDVVLEATRVVEDPIILAPHELTAIAAKILDVLGAAATDGTTLTALELASRLPALASRAGWACRRPRDFQPLLSFESVERLAPLVHLAYQDVSAKTDYATGSPVAHQLWSELTDFMKASNRAVLIGAALGHAVLGFDWRPTEDPALPEWSKDQVECMAELEHRRWAIFQRRNGAERHRWMRRWDGTGKDPLTDDVKEYDRHIVREVPKILKGAGIEVVERVTA